MTLDAEETREKFPLTIVQYLFITIPIIICNVFAMTATIMYTQRKDLGDALMASVFGFTFVLLVVSAGLSLPLSLIRYRGLTYREKYIPGIMFVFTTMQVGIFLFGIIPGTSMAIEMYNR